MSISPDRSVSDSVELDADPGHRAVQTAVQQAGFDGFAEFGAPATPRSVLIQIIEGEIIPRLFLAHRDRLPQRLGAACRDAGDLANCEVLARLFLHGDGADIVQRLEMLMDRGMRREDVYLEFLACVPRTLSLLWEEGHCSFDDVARGLACLDQVLQEMHQREHAGADPH